MNLLIEQRPRKSSSTISSTLLSDGNNDNVLNSSSLSSSSSVSASSSSASASSLVLKLKRQTTSQTSRMTGEDDEEHDDQHTHQQQQLQSRSTRVKQRSQPPSTGTARRPSSPAFNGRQQSTKRSITIDNNNNDLPSHVEEISSTTKRFKSDSNHTSSSSSSNKVDACVETVSIGLATEPDQLGPCEPGTSVVLEGIVWNETDSGVLVVNVTWRGKTYVGTLLDSTKQDWACPRLTCESPTSDYDPRSSSKTSRTKRATAGGTSRSSNANASVSSFQQISSIILSSGLDDRKLRHNIKSRQSKRLNHQQSTTINEENTASPSPLASPHRTNQSFFPSETTTTTSEATLIPCSEANCHKRFTSTVALSYHLSDAHKTSSPSSSSSSSSNNAPPPIVSQANRRDEEDVAHILANVAHYARRSSPPPPAATAERQPLPAASSSTTNTPTALTWPCPQISSNLVQTSSLNNDEREKLADEPIVAASNLLDQTPTNEIDLKTNHSPSTNSTDSSPWNGENKKDRNNNKKRSKTTPVPSGSNSSFVPITLPSTIPLTSSSPAYSDISDEEPSSNPTEPILPPSTINLLSATHSNLEEKTPSTSTPFLPNNTEWTTQMLFQPFGPYISPSSLVPSTNKETNQHQRSTTPNGLNSKNHCSPNSDATVKNILDTRRSSTIPTPSSPPINLYHFHSNGTTGSTTNFSETTKFSPSIINTLTSPNENLLHPSSTTTPVTPTSTPPSTFKPMDLLDYSFNPSNGQYAHSSSLHPSR